MASPQKGKTPNKKQPPRDDSFFDARFVRTYQVIFKTKPEHLNAWYEVIKHRYITSIDASKFTSTSEERMSRGNNLLCSTFRVDIADVDEADAAGKLLIIQVYHTNQKKRGERTIHIQGKCCVKWVEEEFDLLKKIVQEVIKLGLTDPGTIHQHVANNMPQMALPDTAAGVDAAQPEILSDALEKLEITPKKEDKK